jgi:hypothetical protein
LNIIYIQGIIQDDISLYHRETMLGREIHKHVHDSLCIALPSSLLIVFPLISDSYSERARK